MKIGIINNRLGNVESVYSAFKFYGYNAVLINRPEDLKNADMIVLTGVGVFYKGISRLKELNLLHQLNEEVIKKGKPVLGICLGLQLFAEKSYEDGEHKGLGWIKGEVLRIKGDNIRIPHVGWDVVQPIDRTLFRGMRYNYFYFMHSYHFVPTDKKIIKAITRYGDEKIVSAVAKDNIIGVQFHPEKSQGDGLRFLRNVIESVS